MSEALDAPYQPPPKICCCRPYKDGDEYISINAGCKKHGIGIDIGFYTARTVGSSKDLAIPTQAVRNGSGRWHRISEME